MNETTKGGQVELEGFRATQEELVDAANGIRERRGSSDRRVCVCGHPVARHELAGQRVVCTPTRMTCPCGEVLPVIEVSDTRPFLRKTHGPAAEHALLQGLQGLLLKGRTWKWLEGFPRCAKCQATGKPVMPFAINSRQRASLEPEKINVLLCEECTDELGMLKVV